MTQEKKTFGSGDINLAAGILTMGIPADPRKPLELVARDNGHDYVRFHFSEQSFCGLYTPYELSDAWARPASFKEENPDHPFSSIMDFIASRPRGCETLDDWLDHASAFLVLPIDAVRTLYRGIAKTCKASPESVASYICAYVRNREDLVNAIRNRGRCGNFSNMMDRGKSVSMIPAKAPKRIRDFLLSHIR